MSNDISISSPLADSQGFFGFYRGIVKANDDTITDHPYMCRIRISVPQVYGKDIADDDLPWAWPCLAFGGGRSNGNPYGFVCIPPINASVWVAFEQGDPQKPIWLGTWFGEKDAEPEVGEEVQEDSRSGVEYPELLVWKSPKSQTGIYLRLVGDKRIEIVFTKDENYIELDSEKQRIYIKGKAWNVKVESEEGEVRLEGKTIAIKGTDDVTIECDATCTVKSKTSLLLKGKTKATLQSDTIIHGMAPSARGFDQHD